MSHKKLGWVLMGSVAALGLAACGGGGGSKATGFTSGAALQSAMNSPTGTVEPETVGGIAKAFQASNESDGPAFGIRQKKQPQQSGSQTQECASGGSMTVSGTVNGDVYDIKAQLNNCDEGTGCKLNGSIAIFGSASEADEEFTGCFSYDVSGVCTDALETGASGSVSLQFSGCIDTASGSFVYLIEYEGETYTVSGSYSDGSGTLTITGANGSWTCTFTDDAGSCESSAGESFEFTADSGSDDETDEG